MSSSRPNLRPALRALLGIVAAIATVTIATMVARSLPHRPVDGATTNRADMGWVPRAQAQSDSEAWTLQGAWTGDRDHPPGFMVEPRGIAVTDDGVALVVDGAEGRVHVLQDDTWVDAWASEGEGTGQLVEPAGIALLRDDVLVADSGNGRIQRFGRDGTPRGAWHGFQRPWGIAADEAGGHIVVSDRATGTVHVLAADGSRLRTLDGGEPPAGQLTDPVSVATWADGRIAVADAGAGRVHVYAADGTLMDSFEPEGEPLLGVTVAGDDAVQVASGRTVRRWDVNGSPDRSVFGRRVFPEYLNGGIDVQGSGDEPVWVTLRHDWDRLTGVQRWAGVLGGDNERWMDLPEPPGDLLAPRRISADPVSPAQFTVLDELPRVQRLARDGSSVAQIVLSGVSEAEGMADGDWLTMSPTEVRRLRGDTVVWAAGPTVTATWLSAMAWDTDRQVVYVSDVRRQRVERIDSAGNPDGGWDLGTPADGFSTISDMAVRADGSLLLVDRTHGEIEVRDPETGAIEARWAVTGVPARVAPDPAADNPGGAFVLTREGWVWRLDEDGAVRAWWAADRDESGASASPIDIAVGAGGRVYVADGQGDRVLIYTRDRDATIPTPPDGVGCTFVRDKRADPPRITLGETVGVTLTVSGECLEQGDGADVMLVVDRSGSMEGEKLAAARRAVGAFVGDLDFGQSRTGLVAFNLDAQMPVGLTSEPGAVLEALNGFDANGGTDIGKAIDRAAQELRDNGRDGVDHVIVVMTDGRPDNAEVDADDAAQRARAEGIQIYSIGFGPDAATDLMRRIASDPSDYFSAPSDYELAAIYLEIARRISGGVLVETGTLTDVVPDNMAYVQGSAAPPAAWDPALRTLTWQLTDASPGLRFTYRLRPTEKGTHPTNVVARLEYRDGLQVSGELEFPVPSVRVVGPPQPIYLPIAFRNGCPPTVRPADVVLVIDTSSSMTGEKLAAAKEAARRFVSLMTLERDRAAVVGFNTRSVLTSRLTGDLSQLEASIDGLSITPGTVIDAGLARATTELTGERERAEALPVVVLLTDGRNNAGPEPVREAARAALAAGVRLYTIALGTDGDVALMREISGEPARAFVAPGPSDLRRIYEDIVALLPCE